MINCNKELFEILDKYAKDYLIAASCVANGVLKDWLEHSLYAHLLQKVANKPIDNLILKLAIDGIEKNKKDNIVDNRCAEESKQLKFSWMEPKSEK